MVEQFRVPSESPQGVALPVVPDQAPPGARFGLRAARPQGQFDLWLCASCGFSELWASRIGDLVEDPAAGVRLVDTTAEPEGPFR